MRHFIVTIGSAIMILYTSCGPSDEKRQEQENIRKQDSMSNIDDVMKEAQAAQAEFDRQDSIKHANDSVQAASDKKNSEVK